MGTLAKNILTLFKLRIGVAMVFTALVGLAITPGPAPETWQTLLLAMAIILSAGAAGGLNHYYDRDIDSVMDRTQGRPFVTGALPYSPWWLALFLFLTVMPVGLVWYYINATSALHVFLGAFFYGVVYTIWLKRRTWLNIVIGGLAGSFAVLAGAAVVDPVFSPLPIALAFVLFLWTPSHFWSLAIALKPQYVSAHIPMLPVVAGEKVASRAILSNTALLVAASVVPFYYGMGWIYLAGALLGGGYFLAKSLQLAFNPGPALAMSNFRASLVQLMLLLSAVLADQWLPI
ncbi:MAG: protoheme IX farnesyltransferase [Magnetococcales bacterium]|nr:protoheme IX farnesyltransferase [Magnetococcales bacterium]